MKAKYTPGPWYLVRLKHGGFAITNRTGKMSIANSISGETGEEAESNAFAISAVPDLIAACELALHPMADPEEVREALISAIAKAKGET